MAFPGGAPKPKVNKVSGDANVNAKSVTKRAIASHGGTHVKAGQSAAAGSANQDKA